MCLRYPQSARVLLPWQSPRTYQAPRRDGEGRALTHTGVGLTFGLIIIERSDGMPREYVDMLRLGKG